MRDELEAPFLDDWLHDTEVTPPDPQASARDVASRLPHAKQVGRWLPFVVFQPKAQTPTATDTADYQPSPIPATNGRSPTVLGRTQSMFSPVKAITAGALVFAIGGVLLIAQPFDQQGDSVPGAAIDEVFEPPVEVTGTASLGAIGCSPQELGGDLTTTTRERMRYTCRTRTQMSDPRLAGAVTVIYENYYFDGSDLAVFDGCDKDVDDECDFQLVLESGALSIENADGTWRGRPTLNPFVGFPGSDKPATQLMLLDGEGGYEGLVALLEFTEDEDGSASVHGFIIDGGFPPDPENASTK